MRVTLLFSLLAFSVASPVVLAQTQLQPTPATSKDTKAIVAATTTALSDNTATKQIEATVHQYLLNKPEVVVEALQAYQQKQMESMQQLFKDTQKLAPQNADALFHHQGDPGAGNAQGKVTLVEFSDYQCSHCIESARTVDAALKANPNLRIVVKEFPIRGVLSDEAARAALAAAKQGKYWEFRNALFKVSAALTADKIYQVAKEVGLNVDQLKKDMNDQALRDALQANQKLAVSLKLIGTPAFFIAKTDIKNGAPANEISYVPGILSQQQLQSIIDGKKAGK